MERFKFHCRLCKPGESVVMYVAELRSLTEFCNLGGSLEEMICDRLVCGINNSSLQKRLLAEHDLDYKRAVKFVLNAEMALQSIQKLRGKPEMVGRHPRWYIRLSSLRRRIRALAKGAGSLVCYRYGNEGHTMARY